MSKYLKVETQFKDAGLLQQALADVCAARRIQYEQGEGLTLYGYQGKARPERAEFVVRRGYISRSANDLGFHRLPDGSFEIIISEYDSEHTSAAHIAREVKQRYARLKVEKVARARGLQVQEIEGEGGVIRLRLVVPDNDRQRVRVRRGR